MSKVKRQFIQLDYSKPGALRAQDIPYDATSSVRDALSAAVTGPQGPTGPAGGDLRRVVSFDLFPADSTVVVGGPKKTFCVPSVMSNMVLTQAVAGVVQKGETGSTDVQIKRVRGGSAESMLSTDIQLTNAYSASNGIINASYRDVTRGDMLYPVVDTVHTGTVPYGLSVSLTFNVA